MELSEQIKGKNLLYICGLYKTGTSLLTEYIEKKLEYNNPANTSNPLERGYGSKGNRYFTHECKVLREINKEIRLTESVNYIKIENYLTSLTFPAVIKDPLFCITLKYWYEEAKKLLLEPFVVFTTRNRKETMNSWKSAPYTKVLPSQEFDFFYTSFNNQLSFCKDNAIPFACIDFSDIMKLKL